MAKLKPDSISQADLLEYLNDHSDFSFEIEILKSLTKIGFDCEHGGSYKDPVTKKTREFDIRATKVFGESFLRLAVECKNLRDNFPLLISCVPRREDESFHEICISVDPDKHSLEDTPQMYNPVMQKSKNIRLTGNHSLYKTGDPVGKSCDQIGRYSNGGIIANDSKVYEKWSQALSSADDLTYLACTDGNDRTGNRALSLVFPFMVVPNGRLWVTQYDADGNRFVDPVQTDRCSYFVNLSYYHRGALTGDEYNISHLEFVTQNGLLKLIDDLVGDENKLADSFPLEHVLEVVASQMAN